MVQKEVSRVSKDLGINPKQKQGENRGFKIKQHTTAGSIKIHCLSS